MDDSRCILYDCSEWTPVKQGLVLKHFPSCSIKIQSSDVSMSGFIVVFSLQHGQYTACNMALIISVLLSMLVVLYYVMAMLDLDIPLFPGRTSAKQEF